MAAPSEMFPAVRAARFLPGDGARVKAILGYSLSSKNRRRLSGPAAWMGLALRAAAHYHGKQGVMNHAQPIPALLLL